MLKSFFDAVTFRNILEGSTADGHHEAVNLLGDSPSSLELKALLRNGEPSKMRVLEGIAPATHPRTLYMSSWSRDAVFDPACA